MAGLVKESRVVDSCYELGENGWVEGERWAIMFCRKLPVDDMSEERGGGCFMMS